MRHHDKLDQYIKKEIDSIPYDDADKMWEEFQEKNSEQLVIWNKSNFRFPFLIALLFLTIAGITFYTLNQNSISNNQTTVDINLETTFKNNTLTSNIGKEENLKINQTSTGDNENSKPTTLKKENSLLNKNEISFDKKFKSDNSLAQNIFPIEKKSSNEFNKNDLSKNNISLGNQSISKNTSLNILENKILDTPIGFQSKITETAEHQSIDLIELPFLDSRISFLEIKDLEIQLRKIDKCPPYKRRNEYFVRALFSASTNKIYKTSFDIGRVHKLSRNSGFKYSLGFSVTDGYSLSQDSVYITNGLYITETIKEKDLDYMISPFLSTEYFVKSNRLKASVGTRLSYAAYNRFEGNTKTTITDFSGVFQGWSKEEYINHWTPVNRFELEGMLNLSYRFNDFELGLSASKRFNNLIKDNLAERRKSNTPIQFGINLSRYF